MKSLLIIPQLLILAWVAFFVYQFIKEYREATGTVWERSVEACKDSATLLWARFVALVGFIAAYMADLANILGAPGVASAIQTYADPKVVGFVMIAIAIVTELARRRTMD